MEADAEKVRRDKTEATAAEAVGLARTDVGVDADTARTMKLPPRSTRDAMLRKIGEGRLGRCYICVRAG